MSEPHGTREEVAQAREHAEAHVPYMKVFYALLVFTVLEYFYAKLASGMGFSLGALVLGLMILAVTKASLVGIYFMHLKFEGRWVYLMLVPASLLALVLIFALYPDIGQQRTADADAADDEVTSMSAPLNPGPPASANASASRT